MANRLHKVLLALGAASALAGCGGGDGGGDPSPTPQANRPPVLTTTALAAAEDTTLGAQIAATDPDGNALTFVRVNDALHGSLTISATGALSYLPASNYAGADSFSVRVSDGAGGEATGTVNITVAAVNDAPAITFTAFSLTEDATIDGNLNPTDIDSTTLTAERTSSPQHGQVTVAASGLFVYVPTPDYFGTDTFNVRVTDGAGGTTNATVTMTISPVNDPPVLTSNALTVSEDNVLSTQLVSADLDDQALTYSLGKSTEHGQVSISNSGLLTYTPDPNYFGSDTLVVNVYDHPQDGASWPITITVNSVNDLPVAVDDEFRIADGAPKTMTVVTNDTDVEGGAMTVSIVQQPSGGTVTVGAGNVLTFTPVNDFAGPVTFTYRLTDTDGGHDDATVRALIGNFQGLVYLADDLTPGRQEIFLFDGLRSTRIVQGATNGYEFITRFTVSDDGSKLLYVVAGPLVDQFYVKPINTPGSGTKIWENAPLNPPNGAGSGWLALNRTGTYALIEDRYSAANKRIYIVNTSAVFNPNTVASGLLGGDEPQVVRAAIVVFNPQNENQVVLQGQIGGVVPPAHTGESYSAFTANVTTPRDLTQIGANYPQNQGSGSGFGFWFGGAGRYLYHTEFLPSATPVTKTLLMYDNNTGIETVMYRRPTGNERGLTIVPTGNADGSSIFFAFSEPNPTDGDGPAAYYVTHPTTPTTATPLTPVYPRSYYSYFASDGVTVIYYAFTASGSRLEAYAVNTSGLTVPVKVSKTLDQSEELARLDVARGAQRILIGYRTAPSEETRLFSVPVPGSPGPEIPVSTNFPYYGFSGDGIDDKGLTLAYAALEGSRRILRIQSTQTLDYSIPVMGAGSTAGVTQFRWLPRP